MHLARRRRRAASATILRVVEPRTMESSTTTTRCPAMRSRQRVELQPQPVLAQALVGLDERAADVAVLDQPVGERQPAAVARSPAPPGCPSRAPRSRRRRRGRLVGQALAHAVARAPCSALAVHARVGPREVDELEDAQRRVALARRRRPARRDTPGASRIAISPGSSSRTRRRADDVERAGLRGQHGVARRGRPAPAGGCRPGSRKPMHALVVEHDRREGALDARHGLAHAVARASPGARR